MMDSLFTRFSMAAAALLVSVASFGQFLTPDVTFNSDDAPGYTGPNQAVRAMAVLPDQRILAGGEFTQYNMFPTNRIVRLMPDGTRDCSFNPGTGANGTIHCVALLPDGRMMAGGDFTEFNGQPAGRVVRLMPDGAVDPTFQPGTGATNGSVRAMAVWSDGSVALGGTFTQFDGGAVGRIVRLLPDGSVDAGYALGSGAASQVNALALMPDGRLMVGGDFASFDGEAVMRLARLTVGGAVDVGFQPVFTNAYTVTCLHLTSEGKLYVGGGFDYMSGPFSAYSVARLGVDGLVDTGFNPHTTSGGAPRSVTELADGKVLVAGDVYDANFDFKNLLMLNANGSDTGALPYGQDPENIAYAVAGHGTGHAVVGGAFTWMKNQRVSRLVRITTGVQVDADFNAVGGFDRSVYKILPLPDGKWLVGGSFTGYFGEPRSGIARLNADGTLDMSFHPGTGVNLGIGMNEEGVYDIAVQSDGKIIIGGSFNSFDGIPRTGLARLHADGSLDEAYNPVLAGPPTPQVRALIHLPDDALLIAGVGFNTVNGVSRPKVARLLVDGSTDPGFSAGTGANNSIYQMKMTPDGKIVIAGDFTQYNGTARNRIARLLDTGALDQDFAPVTGFGIFPSIRALVVQPDGKVLVGGGFSTYEGSPSGRLVRINTDGSKDNGFDIGTGATGDITSLVGTQVNAIHLAADGKIWLFGTFNVFNGETRNRFARVNADGSNDGLQISGNGFQGFYAHLYEFGFYASMTFDANDQLVLGGNFRAVDGLARNMIVRFNPENTDCAGIPGGSAYADQCGTCVGGTTGLSPCNPFCEGPDIIPGCTDAGACNYNPAATVDNGSCNYDCICDMDLNGDGIVNWSDLVEFFALYGCTVGCDGDINQDGVVDATDFFLFLGAYGSYCD